MDDPKFETPGDKCPTCGKPLTVVRPLDGLDVPMRPGDFTICGHCGEMLTFDKKLKHVRPTEDQLKQVPQAFHLISANVKNRNRPVH